MTNDTAYAELVSRLKRAHVLGTINGLLGWDEQVNLPADSADLRAEQLAAMAELQHAAASDPRVGELLAMLEGRRGELTADQQVVVRVARRDYDRVVKLPPEFVREKARHGSQAFHAWAACKPKADFAGFAPFLQKHLDLARQEAAYLGFAAAPYDYLVDRHDPGMTAATIGRLFDELKAGLVPFMQAVVASPVKARTEILSDFPVEKQRAFLRMVTEQLGFNYRRGRIDVSVHPFCEGTAADVRMTTKFKEDR
ncbi:MAG TPA: carboxypeptidase M32, partial [Opitutaceae bacterium]|nr:carboxypeptidase M32 [Opitutaceae bacterium]